MSRSFFVALILIAIAGLAAWLWIERPDVPADEAAAAVAQTPKLHSGLADVPAALDSPITPAKGPPDFSAITGAEAAAIAGLDARTLTSCHRAVRKREGIARVNCDDLEVNDVAARNQCGKQHEFLRAQLEVVTAAAAPCPESLAQPSVYYQAVRNLAKDGDTAAQRCFIQGYFGIDREQGINLSQAEYDEYRGLARKFIEAGLARGDWSIVRWLSKPRVGFADFLLASAHPMGLDDRVNAYKVRRLLMLGNQPGLGTLEQDDPARLVEYWRRENWLSANQLEEAESWAKTMYEQHFIGSREGVAIGPVDFCPGE